MSPDASLQAFVRAAAMGGTVWAWRFGNDIHVVTSDPGRARGTGTAQVLVELLRDVFGRGAAAAAERSLQAAGRGGVPAPLVLQVIEDAEASRSVLQGAAFGLRLRYSALAGGHGYRRLCQRLGIDPKAMPAERRQAIDNWVNEQLSDDPLPPEERLQDLLQQALQQPLN